MTVSMLHLPLSVMVSGSGGMVPLKVDWTGANTKEENSIIKDVFAWGKIDQPR